MREKMYENYLKCFDEPESSEELVTKPKSDEKKCPKSFDQVLCWEETPPNKWAYQDCPEWVIGFENNKGKAKRFCQENGTWTLKNNSNLTYTDYRACIENLDEKSLLVTYCLFFYNDSFRFKKFNFFKNNLPIVKLIAKIGNYLSVGSLIFAIILLLAFK